MPCSIFTGHPDLCSQLSVYGLDLNSGRDKRTLGALRHVGGALKGLLRCRRCDGRRCRFTAGAVEVLLPWCD